MNFPTLSPLRVLLLSAILPALSGCAVLNEPALDNRMESMGNVRASDTPLGGAATRDVEAAPHDGPLSSGEESTAPGAASGADYEIIDSDGYVINAGAARRAAADSDYIQGDIVLNFENSDIREVIDNILGDMLGVNYVVDPTLKGTVSLVTTKPITADAVLPTLETLLRLNGAVLSVSDGVYIVSPQNKGIGGVVPRVSIASGKGYQMLVVPLRYIGAVEMQSVLEPMIGDAKVTAVDPDRNLIVIAGSESQLRQARATVDIFDVDQMRGMSVGVFRLQASDADRISQELQEIMGAGTDGPLAGMVRFVTITRLNALVVISPQRRYVDEARDWIERLDRAEQSAGSNMYVYPVQNGRAENIAALLSEMFGTATQAPGAVPGTSGSGARSPSPLVSAGGAGASSSIQRSGITGQAGTDNGVRIIADAENNALLIMATREEHAKILSAVRRLDVLPLQVLVEATIVEVSLTGDLSFGLQWFFKNGIKDYNATGELFPLAVDPSFSYTVADPNGQVRAVLNALAADSRLEVISSPSLMVLDNHTATIKVGDQVPIRTSETTSLATSGENPLVTSTIQYRDTGVMLEVTPRVNPGGMVVLDITQDVNDVDNTTTSAIDSPTIVQRQITTSVVVRSGETVVLGGLIRENDSESDSGVPWLRRVPGLGRLFSSKRLSNIRTELLVLITPTAVSNVAEARDATRAMQQKLSSIDFGE